MEDNIVDSKIHHTIGVFSLLGYFHLRKENIVDSKRHHTIGVFAVARLLIFSVAKCAIYRVPLSGRPQRSDALS